MDGKEHGVCIFHRLPGGAGLCISPGVPRELLELLLASGVAEHNFMSGSGKNGAELSSHQSRSKYPNAHDDLSLFSGAVVAFEKGLRRPAPPPAGSWEEEQKVISRLFAPVPQGTVRLEP